MTARDKTEVGSKFWNKGKWDNFVLPFLPEDPKGLTFIDIGCNAGLFLNFAYDMGFENIVGVDSNEKAIKRGKEWRDKNDKEYELRLEGMEGSLQSLPMSDYVVLANVHYYFKIDDWLYFLDQLQYKTRNVIVVTTKKRPGNRWWAQADKTSLSYYFKHWIFGGITDPISTKGDPRPRELWGMKFTSPHIKRVGIDSLDSGNHVQDEFYSELDAGKSYAQTKYYRIIKKYRLEDKKDWTPEKLVTFFEGKVSLYEDIKEFGLIDPILLDRDDRVLDGNHRCQMLKHLGHKTVLVRKI